MKRKWIVLYICFIGVVVLILTQNQPIHTQRILSDYYILNSHAKINAPNVVTAIYLYFRYYDTLFETFVLLFSIMGIITISIHEGEDYDE